jgi:hypothetical protein
MTEEARDDASDADTRDTQGDDDISLMWAHSATLSRIRLEVLPSSNRPSLPELAFPILECRFRGEATMPGPIPCTIRPPLREAY